ncbi:MAG TPA: hypothetical protein K8V11_11380 [Dietzia timorensis]|uniref:DUF8176 domain-containing protein n=1 Tax=Dietzia timorensis TaxID=499555 RepID=A0A921JYS3_9ACTN|nr:hypothetical protein [Dietzia timorensis]HJE91595.1 hypothetical protein [Dietzia timorensis]
MSTPPWIRSAIDNGLAAARLESQAGGQSLPPAQSDDTDRKHDPADKSGSEGGGPELEQEGPPVAEGTVDAPLELDLVPRADATLVASLRERVRGETTREEGDEPGAHSEEQSSDPDELGAPARVTAGPLKTTAALVGLVSCIAGGFALGGGFDSARTAEASELADIEAQSAQVPIVESDDGCETEHGEGFFRGNGAGDRLSPVGVVAAFEYAYYVEKDPIRALELTTEEAGLDPARLNAEGIGALPEGTTHCVEATAEDDEAVFVRLSERRPDVEPIVIHQRIHTGLDDNGIYAITKIEHTEGRAE